MRSITVVLLAAAMELAASRHSFDLPRAGDAVAEIEMSAPGADWAVAGREAALAVVRVNGRPDHHVFVHSAPATYRVFLGAVTPGRHELSIERDERYSAPGARLDVRSVRVTDGGADRDVVAHAPAIFARRNTVGLFSDIPLMAYCERLTENGAPVLQYTIVFSNEDGGTSTRALMARWGRTTDIEYVARVYLNAGGTASKTIVQGPGHKDVEFRGEFDGSHALLMPTTNNNMIGEAAGSPLRFQFAPVIADLNTSSRERLMDETPYLYDVMAKELVREGKLRPFGTVAGENISDPRNFAYVEYRASHKDSAFVVTVFIGGRGYGSDLGRIDYAIERDGWVRTAIELPPGTKAADIERVAFGCIVPPPKEKGGKMAQSGTCSLERVGKAFFLDANYRPGASWLRVEQSVNVPTGESASFRP